jgi:tetratricopeptide (TPR) repeat protein
MDLRSTLFAGSLVVVGAVVSAASPAAAAEPIFEEVATAVGLDFVHFNGMSGGMYMSEMMGSGAAVFDYDNDGDLDVYLVQGAMLEKDMPPSAAAFPPTGGAVPSDRLFRNDTSVGPDGGVRLRFTDVTAAAELDMRGYGMGVAAADYDNDGWVDLYVTNLGSNVLLHNDGDGTFSDRTAAAGVDDPRWSVSSSFFDADRDGRLDLFVTNYVDFGLDNNKVCRDGSGARDYCGPMAYGKLPDRLFRNRGDGTFEDISAAAGIARVKGAGLGVVAADFDNDGWLDLYVANDRDENRLWVNQRNGSFKDNALLAGCAVNLDGRTESSMGVAAGDLDEDGDEDLFTTHLGGETNTLYVNDGKGNFTDGTIAAGLAGPSLRFTSFGADFRDLDNDGWLDLLVVNGAMIRKPELVRAGDPYPLHEPNQLYRNLGGGRFEDATALGGPALALSEVSHGAAFGDLDNDGDVDVVVTNNNGPVRLLVNRSAAAGPWIGLEVVDPSLKRDALGARLQVIQDEVVRHRRVAADGSYASASDPRLVVGLADRTEPVSVVVTWPDGRVEAFSKLEIGAYNRLHRGAGRIEGVALEETPAPVLSGVPDTVLDHVAGQAAALAAARADRSLPSAELAEVFGETGRAYQAYALLDEAAPCYRNAGRLDSEEPRWAYLLGTVELERGRTAEALDAFDRCRRLGGDRPVVLARRAEALLRLGRFDEAESSAREAVERDPALAAAYSLAGQAAVARGDPAAAVESLKVALELQPQATKLVYPLAASLLRLGRDEEAEAWAARRGDGSVVFPDPELAAIEDLNRSSSHQVDRCLEALDAERPDRAVGYCRRALVLDGANLEARINLAVAFARLGMSDRAIAENREVLRTAPANLTARFNLAALLAGAGDDQAALFHLDRLVSDDPEHVDGRFNRANALRRLGRCGDAVEDYEVVIGLDPGRTAAAVGEAMCLVTLGRSGEARSRLEQALGANPDDLAISDALARVLSTASDDRLRDGARAVELARRVAAAERGWPSLETLAMALAETGDLGAAAEVQAEAVEAARSADLPGSVDALEARRLEYLSGSPCRTPWR